MDGRREWALALLEEKSGSSDFATELLASLAADIARVKGMH